jgi:Colicin D
MPAPVNFDRNQLRDKWKHAKVFGLSGNPTVENLKDYQQGLEDHINDSNTQEIMGRHRGAPCYHYYNKNNRRWVAVDMNRNYISGWRLSLLQEKYLFSTGNVQ